MRGESTVYCTTDLCLSVDKLKKEKKQQGRNNVGVKMSVSTWCAFCAFCQLLKLRILTNKTENFNLNKPHATLVLSTEC